MINEKQKKLMTYLIEHPENISAQKLADKLSFSLRSVKNYIKQINEGSDTKIIYSGRNGYSINAKEAKKMIGREQAFEECLPQNYEERSLLINQLLLSTGKLELDALDFCDDYFISFSTLKADVRRMNTNFVNYGVTYRISTNRLFLDGEETNIRHLAKYIFFDQSRALIERWEFSQSMHNINTEEVSMVIETVFSEFGIYLDDIVLRNLVVHISIIIDRIKLNNLLPPTEHEKNANETEERILATLCQRFEEVFHLTVNEEERHNIYLLLKANVILTLTGNPVDVQKFVGEEVYQLTIFLTEKASRHYHFDFNNQEFINSLSLHMKKLMIRGRHGAFLKNPMLASIRKTNPLIMDMGVYAGYWVEKKTGIEINEDECSFIALYFGNEIEKQKQNQMKVNAVLLCPNYMDISSKIYNKLMIEFGHNLVISKVLHHYEPEKFSSCELLITTIDCPHVHQVEEVRISPYFVNKDRYALQNVIDDLLLKRKNQVLKDYFDMIFNEKIFSVNEGIDSAEQCMKYMADQMVTGGYVNENFYERLLERDQAASVGFDNFALPHSIKIDAISTGIGVMISHKGILWHGRKVHVVFTVALNKSDRQIFRDLFESLVELMSDSQKLNAISQSTSFEEFKRLFDSLL